MKPLPRFPVCFLPHVLATICLLCFAAAARSQTPVLPTKAASATRLVLIWRCTEMFHWLILGGLPPLRSM